VTTEGMDMGRPCCSVHNCNGDLRTPQDHWCMAHSNQAHFCVVEGCALDGNGHHTCSAHATVKDYHNAGGRVMFTL
ncbi:hypothetical protein C8Q70DRAFT_891324, partial [Cubamyces menziesii]